MKKFASLALASALATTSLSASDLLSKATGGAISDNSFGIKKLNNSQMSDVKGGYVILSAAVSSDMAIAVAAPDDFSELGVLRDHDSGKLLGLYSELDTGICDAGVRSCYSNDKTYTHSQRSKNRFMEYVQALGDYKLVEGYLLAFTVKKNIITDRYGNRNVYFSYGTAAYNIGKKSIHPITTTNFNNTIVRELRDITKDKLETELNFPNNYNF
ncbi:hypothetical protein [Campylobacter sp. 19-13652]|uniref:hypothetical protein n=1 Tax=Campylobacter sp. 19-13652 TaxID=2840180 RepID=UPI001C787B13|nr:hypothetical protein [Campylobacter sp. 19-13652]BCX78640.1 hypothetical protein LBC_01020 [Campylobacter sp. 19-13652]